MQLSRQPCQERPCRRLWERMCQGICNGRYCGVHLCYCRQCEREPFCERCMEAARHQCMPRRPVPTTAQTHGDDPLQQNAAEEKYADVCCCHMPGLAGPSKMENNFAAWPLRGDGGSMTREIGE